MLDSDFEEQRNLEESNLFSCYLCDAVFENQDSIRKHVENCGKTSKSQKENPPNSQEKEKLPKPLKSPMKHQKMPSNHLKTTKYIRVTPQTIAHKKVSDIGENPFEKSVFIIQRTRTLSSVQKRAHINKNMFIL